MRNPRWIANCICCGRIVDTRERHEGGDKFGVEVDKGRWVCSNECWHIAVADASPASAAPVPAAAMVDVPEHLAYAETSRGKMLWKDIAQDAFDTIEANRSLVKKAKLELGWVPNKLGELVSPPADTALQERVRADAWRFKHPGDSSWSYCDEKPKFQAGDEPSHLEPLAANTVEFTEWERVKMLQAASANALTYMGHHATGKLRPNEIEEMERWKTLSDKLSSLDADLTQPKQEG